MDKISSLKKLKGLLEEGIITEEEFARQKGIILGDITKPKEAVAVPSSAEDSHAPHTPAVDIEQEEEPQDTSYPSSDTVPSVDEQNEDEDLVYDSSVELQTQAPVDSEEEKLKRHKLLLGVGIFICAIGIILGIVYLFNESIVDRVAKYEKAGIAIIDVQQSGLEQYAIIMDKKGLYYDDKFSVKKLVPVGEEVKTREVRLRCDANGLKSVVGESEQNLAITTSRGQNVIRLTATSFLLITKKLAGNPMTDYNLSMSSGYLIIKKDKSTDATVIRIPESKTDGYGNLCWSITGDILDQYGTYFKTSFSKNDYNTIVKRKYGRYLASVELSLTSGKAEIVESVHFDKLDKSYPSNEVGTLAHSASMRSYIQGILRSELVESFYANAEAVTNYHNRNDMRISPDDKYTFVIVPNYYTGRDHVAVFKVNNKTKAVTILNSGMSAEFRNDCISIKKYKEFWFFDSYEYVDYDYSGKLIRD